MNFIIIGYFFRIFHWPLTLCYVQTWEDFGTRFLARLSSFSTLKGELLYLLEFLRTLLRY